METAKKLINVKYTHFCAIWQLHAAVGRAGAFFGAVMGHFVSDENGLLCNALHSFLYLNSPHLGISLPHISLIILKLLNIVFYENVARILLALTSEVESHPTSWPEGFPEMRPDTCGSPCIARKFDAQSSIEQIKKPGHRMNATPSTHRNSDPSNGINRRRHPRVAIDNLVSVVSIDEHGNQISQSMGRALNLSQSGVRVETPHPVKPFDAGRVSLVTIDREDNLVKTNGRIVYSRRNDTGTFTTGIQLSGLDTVKKRFVVSLIRQYSYSRPSSQAKIAAA